MTRNHRTKVVYQGKYSFLGKPTGRIVAGVLLIASSCVVLWWNEGPAIQAGRDLGDTSIIISTSPAMVEPINEGRLVHVSGQVLAATAVQDTDLDLVFDNALAVSRIVEMFQWIESPISNSHKPLPAPDYTQGWSKDWHDSSKFQHPQGHQNPEMQMKSQRWTATDAKLGAFDLTDEALANLETATPVTPVNTPAGWTRLNRDFYLSLNPAHPTLGDLRVRFSVLKAPNQVSILARQTETGFAAYRMLNGNDLFVVQLGNWSADQLVEMYKQLDSALTWTVRIAGMSMLWLGLYLVSRQARPRVLHPARTTVTGSTDAVIALAIAFPLGLSTIATAWLFYSPVMSITFVAIGIVVALALVRYTKTKPQWRQEPVSTAPAIAV